MAHSKAALRSRIRERRQESREGAASGGSAAALLATATSAGLLTASGRSDVVGSVTVAAYIATPSEPDVAAIRSAVRSAGGCVLLPLPAGDRRLSWAADTGHYVPDRHLPVSVPEGPGLGTGAQPLIDRTVSVVFLPALAVDRAGGRLGQGGGYYDQLLAELALRDHRVLTVAVVNDDEVLDVGLVPREAHDQVVSAVLTPTQFLVVAP